MLSLSQPTGQPEKRKKKENEEKEGKKATVHRFQVSFFFFSFRHPNPKIMESATATFGQVPTAYSRVPSVGSGFFRPLASCGLLVQSTLSKVHVNPPHVGRVGYSKVGANLCAL